MLTMTQLSKHGTCRFISNLTSHQISSSCREILRKLTCQTLHITCVPGLDMTHQVQLLVAETQIKGFQKMQRLERWRWSKSSADRKVGGLKYAWARYEPKMHPSEHE